MPTDARDHIRDLEEVVKAAHEVRRRARAIALAETEARRLELIGWQSEATDRYDVALSKLDRQKEGPR